MLSRLFGGQKTPAEQMEEGFNKLTTKTEGITETLDSLESQIEQFQSDIQVKQRELQKTGNTEGIIKLINETIEFSEMKKKIRFVRYANQVLKQPNLLSVEHNLSTMKQELDEINKQIEKLRSVERRLGKLPATSYQQRSETLSEQRKQKILNHFKQLDIPCKPPYDMKDCLNNAIIANKSNLVSLIIDEMSQSVITAEHFLYAGKNDEIFKILLVSSINPGLLKTKEGVPVLNALMGTANHDNIIKFIKKMYEADKTGKIFNQQDLNGGTALHSAIQFIKDDDDAGDIVHQIMMRGANGNIQDENGNTPLHIAVIIIKNL